MEMDNDGRDEIEPIDRRFPKAKAIVEERAAELEAKLRPVLDELGLEVRIWNEEERYAISFQQPRRPGIHPADRSPIAILFEPRYFRQHPETNWGGSAITEIRLSARSLGKTGFKSWRDWTREEGDEQVKRLVTVDDNQFLRWLRKRIRTKGLVNFERKDPGFIQNDDLVDAYFDAVEYGEVKGLSIVTFQNENEQREALTFLDIKRQRVHVVFSGSNANIFVDGQSQGYIVSHRTRDVTHALSSLKEGRQPGCHLFPSRADVWNPYGKP